MEGHSVPEVRAGHGRVRCAGGKGRAWKGMEGHGVPEVRAGHGRARCAGGKGRAWKGMVCRR